MLVLDFVENWHVAQKLQLTADRTCRVSLLLFNKGSSDLLITESVCVLF